MKVKPLFDKINTAAFLEDLLTAYGVRDMKAYLHPSLDMMDSPWDYPNMDKAVEVFHRFVESKKGRIGILIDCDFDGYSSGAILCDFLHKLGLSPIPIHHLEKQHGLSNDVFQTILDSNFDLLCLPDSGTNNTERCKILQENGTEVLILDHHLVDIENPYAIVINPNLSSSLNHALSGCGTTYKFIQAYCDKYNIDLPNYMDMVACSIVSDMCDLTVLENRAFLEYGLNMDSDVEEGKQITNPMLARLFKEMSKGSTTPTDVSWSIAPKINALCRSFNQESKEIFFNALISNSEEEIERGIEVAKKAHEEQSDIVQKLSKDLIPNIDNDHNAIIVFIDNEYRNYSGLIANKILGQFHKPTLVLRDSKKNAYSGSQRAHGPLAPLINETKLAKCEGHAEASGINIYKSNLENLIEWFDEQDFPTEPETPVTAILEPKQISTRLCNICESYKHIWGCGTPAPVFYIETNIKPFDVKMFKKKFTTLKITIGNVNFLKFRANKELVGSFDNFKKMRIGMLVSLETNTWNGKTSPQALIQNIEIIPQKELNEENWEDLF